MSNDPENLETLGRAILELVAEKNYQPLKPKALARKLGLSKDDAKLARKAVKKLVKRGQLAFGKNHTVRRAGEDAAAARGITGVFRRTKEGYGFVVPSTAAPGDRSGDLFVAAENARDAASGDIVLAKVTKRRGRRGRPEGLVLEVIERETHQFVGTYYEEAGQGFVVVDGTLFAQPVLVGDPGAKNAREDDKVVFEMVRFPSHAHDGEGVLTEVLGPRGAPGVDTLSIIREFGLPGEFPEDALQEARRQAELFDEAAIGGRLDLTAETSVTIDPVDARDFDDAISLERLENGHWRLGVHIADVGHFVPPGSALDREACRRATSVYLPDRVIPMLPELISNGLASLQPERVRYTKTVFIEFTADGARVAADLQAAAIRSDRRFTYEEIDDYLARPSRWEGRLTPQVHSLVGDMHRLAMILRGRRQRRGSLELSMPEVKVDLDAEGRVCGAHVVEYTESHQIIEEFMLAANEAVAETLSEAGWEFLRRVHPAPSPRKLQALTAFVKELGLDAGNLQDRFALQALLNDLLGHPEQHAVHYAVLRSLARAVYSPATDGHFALAAEHYCHFTSPIRRYPDLTVHRLVDGLHAGRRPGGDLDRLAAEGEHCSQLEQRAEAAERELTKVKLLGYLSERVGEQLDAVITGVETYGMFAQGVELPAEGLIHISSLDDDYYRFDRAGHVLVGHRRGNQFRLGDLVRVEVVHVDLERRELDLRLIAKLKRPPAKKKAAKKAARKKARKKAKKKTVKKSRAKRKTEPAKRKTARPAKRKRGRK